MVEEFPCIKSEPLELPRPPARASEAFLSTIAQGMWAEEKLMEAINSSPHLRAIKYGQSRYNHELISSKEGKELSITVKEEDIERLIKWRKTYCGSKPLFYLQLFFDKGFFISFDEVLEIINQAKTRKVKHYRFEVDRKTGKATYFIGMSHAKVCLIAIEHPKVIAKSIKAWDGKVYAIRTPEGGKFKLTEICQDAPVS